jgi:hypothetical protein
LRAHCGLWRVEAIPKFGNLIASRNRRMHLRRTGTEIGSIEYTPFSCIANAQSLSMNLRILAKKAVQRTAISKITGFWMVFENTIGREFSRVFCFPNGFVMPCQYDFDIRRLTMEFLQYIRFRSRQSWSRPRSAVHVLPSHRQAQERE